MAARSRRKKLRRLFVKFPILQVVSVYLPNNPIIQAVNYLFTLLNNYYIITVTENNRFKNVECL